MILLVLLCSFTMTACHPPATVTTPQAKTAYAADQVITRLGEMQQSVIDASDAKLIPVSLARQIVSWTMVTIKDAQTAPEGWRLLARVSWPQLAPEVGKVPALASWVPVIDALIGGN